MSTFYGPQSTRAREPETKPVRTRCCGRCKTPYGCGNPACTCHKTTPSLEDLVRRSERNSK
jgi:hypothetical protein